MSKHNFRRTIFIPVGTTYIQKSNLLFAKAKLETWRDEIQTFKQVCDTSEKMIGNGTNKINWCKWRECVPNSEYLIQYADDYKKEVDVDEEIRRRINQEFSMDKPDKLTAELASTYLFYQSLGKRNNTVENSNELDLKDEIFLLASDTSEGLLGACFLAEYFSEIAPFKDNIGDINVERITRLGGDQAAGGQFQEIGLSNLVEQMTTLILERLGERPIYINITGGYKGALPYLTLLGMAFGKVDLFYLFEFSSDIAWLPKLPIGFDLFTWRDYRVFIRSIPQIEGFKEEHLPAFIPEAMRILLQHDSQSNRVVLNILGKALYSQYEKERGRDISEHGKGYLLTELISCPAKKSAIRSCIDYWQHLWIGDLIPETVEHGRGHVQRDLELLAQIVFPILREEPNFFHANDQINDDSLLILISAIWLHDLGHSGCYLECNNEDGSLADGTDIRINISGFPSMVRDLHHLLSWYLIRNDQEDLFRLGEQGENSSGKGEVFHRELINHIRQACLYHRGKMPTIKGKSYNYLGFVINKPLDDDYLPSNGGVNLPLIGALLRMADEGEVQRERTVSKEYEQMRLLQNKRELERLKEEEASLRSLLKSLLVSEGGIKVSLTELNELIGIADIYFSDNKELDRAQREEKDKAFDGIVDHQVRNFFALNNKAKSSSKVEVDIIYRNWLSTLNKYIFKKRQPAHFNKHRGISYLMYLLDENDKDSQKIVNGCFREYHYNVLAIYRKGKDDEETKSYILNAQNVLRSIKEEYVNVISILNKNRIYINDYWIMEEGAKIKVKVDLAG